MRKINLHFDDVPATDWDKAIGRLSGWAYAGYDTVDIYLDGKTDFVAHYSDTDSDRKYTIGAVWREDGYTFHS